MFRPFRKVIKKIGRGYYKLKICDTVSVVIAFMVIFTAFFVENWIIYNCIAIAISVGSIKMLYF
jgi:hypothetical protein